MNSKPISQENSADPLLAGAATTIGIFSVSTYFAPEKVMELVSQGRFIVLSGAIYLALYGITPRNLPDDEIEKARRTRLGLSLGIFAAGMYAASAMTMPQITDKAWRAIDDFEKFKVQITSVAHSPGSPQYFCLGPNCPKPE